MEAILIVANGVSTLEGIRSCLKPMIKEVKNAFPESYISLAFTSEFIIAKLFKNSGICISNPQNAIKELIKKGYEKISILSLYIIPGVHYFKLREEAREYKNVKITAPLLTQAEDFKKLINLLRLSKDKYYVFMAHGSKNQGKDAYLSLQNEFLNLGYSRAFVGTIESKSSLEHIILELNREKAREVTLTPFLLTRGKHSTADLNNWQKVLEESGFSVCKNDLVFSEICEVRKIYISKLINLRDTFL